jgi:ketosteroid isomerase-like protein
MTDNMSIIQKSYTCGKDGDIEGMIQDIAPDGKWVEMAGNLYAGTSTGQKEILGNVFARINEDWSEFAAVPEDFLDAGDRIVVLGNYSGKHRKTGKSFKARFTHVWTLKGGQITHFEQFADTAVMRHAAQQPYTA